MTVLQHAAHFIELACFAPYLVADEENRVVCFEIKNFVELVKEASLTEDNIKKSALAMMDTWKRTIPPNER